jgi:elongation factor P--(R)-beta-lysine ligase
MSSPPDWLPTTSVAQLALRAHLMRAARSFFDSRGYIEVDVPLLSFDRAVDPHLEPFVIEEGGGRSRSLYLQTSPEFGMKRLLAAGLPAIYQLSHVFRRGESGVRHNPEFTMLEWYRAGDTYHQQMQCVEEFVVALYAQAKSTSSGEQRLSCESAPLAPFRKSSYREAFLEHAGADVLVMSVDELRSLARRRGVQIPEGMSAADRDDWLNLLLAELVEPKLGTERPEFLFDYPASQAALAAVTSGPEPVAQRFELYICGVEICNGYQELTDTADLERRISLQNECRTRAGEPPLHITSRLADAMRHGLPESSGVALGFDRLMMAITGAASIADVISFPFDRA